jgi:hypothetical protein
LNQVKKWALKDRKQQARSAMQAAQQFLAAQLAP